LAYPAWATDVTVRSRKESAPQWLKSRADKVIQPRLKSE
jgi:hypothetical protein